MLPPLNRRVTVLGDVMLDWFLYGDAERISPEAPVPVVRLKNRVSMAGGAGNVARNLGALGGEAIILGLIGQDADGSELEKLAGAGARLVRSSERRTTVKLRVVAARQQMVRIDDESLHPASEVEQRALLSALKAVLPDTDALVLSDYGKGVLTTEICLAAIAAAQRAGVFCLVDPKGRDYTKYAGADVITPNASELAVATGLPTVTDAQVEAAARVILDQVSVKAVLATRSEKGMMLIPRDGPAIAAPAMAREVFDVSGAGDTAIAMLALSVAAGLPLEHGMRLANAAASVVVGKLGTAVCSAAELEHALRIADGAIGEVLDLPDAKRLASEWRADGLKVGFANGCFDILHAGHVRMLSDARRHCDRLIVALNDDASVSRLKGPERPLNSLPDRAAVIGALSFVDAVVSFAQDTPIDIIRALRPDRLFKGADYALENVVGAQDVAGWGGQTVLLDLLPGRSTTGLVAKARVTS